MNEEEQTMTDRSNTQTSGKTRVIRYDDFRASQGYDLDDYLARWTNIYGPGEMANEDTRTFDDGVFTVSAIPYKTTADEGTFDHIKYMAASAETFAVPKSGSITLEATITAHTPGVEEGHVVRGVYGPKDSYPDGKPYEATLLLPQQAAVTMHLIDFNTGQLFDWLIADGKAMSLVERLPSDVTQSMLPTGPNQMYTQIIREHAISEGPHRYGIRFWRDGKQSGADFSIDGEVVDRVDHIGIPLDRQGAGYSGKWPALGEGEDIGQKIDNLTLAHGLFSLLDAFPFQHPGAPDKSVSMPASERLFGQGAEGKFEDFVVTIVED